MFILIKQQKTSLALADKRGFFDVKDRVKGHQGIERARKTHSCGQFDEQELFYSKTVSPLAEICLIVPLRTMYASPRSSSIPSFTSM